MNPSATEPDLNGGIAAEFMSFLEGFEVIGAIDIVAMDDPPLVVQAIKTVSRHGRPRKISVRNIR